MSKIKLDNNLFISLGLPGTDGRKMKKEYGNCISPGRYLRRNK